MTAAEILELAWKLCEDETISFDDGGKAWLNEALTELGVNANLFSTTTIAAAAAKTFYPLPADTLDVVEVLDSDGELYMDFDARGGNIRFADADTYSVICRRLPAEVTTADDTPEVHQLFHPALALFVASRFKSADDDENKDANRLMSEFFSKASDAAKTLKRQARRSTAVKVIRGA